jgi:8-oxo-dGTP diphosphatase
MKLIAAAAIVDRLEAPTRLLAARRSAPARVAGRWEFPGGKVEENETPIEAVHREIGEELGVTLRVAELVLTPAGTDRWPITPQLQMMIWLAEISGGEPATLQDHDELRWLTPEQLESVPWLDPDWPIVRTLSSHIARRRGGHT